MKKKPVKKNKIKLPNMLVAFSQEVCNKRGVATCPGCQGEKVQKNNQGLKVICPVCKGSGEWEFVEHSFTQLPFDRPGGFIC